MKKMHFRPFLAGALIALTFASCSKENNDIDVTETKSVELKIAGLTPASKAVENESQEGHAAEFNSATIIFYNGNTVYDTFTTGSDLTVQNLEEGHVFHAINKAATGVMVVGNKTLDLSERTIPAIKAQTISIADEQGNGVTLIGENSLSAGEEDFHPEDGNVVTLVKTNVTIAPLVSRFEIKSIGCSDLGTDYQELNLNTIGLFNFAETATLAGVASDLITLGSYTPLSGNIFPIAKPGNVDTEYDWYHFGVDAPWSCDNLEAALTPTAKSATAGTDKVWAYNFIPENTTNIMLQINGESFVRTKDFTGITGFEAGKIYQMSYTFTEENVGPFDPETIVCAEVTVTVKDWDIVTVTPVFE